LLDIGVRWLEIWIRRLEIWIRRLEIWIRWLEIGVIWEERTHPPCLLLLRREGGVGGRVTG